MPELPEVESVRRGLVAARLRGTVETVWRSPAKLRIGTQRSDEGLVALEGATPGKIRRRGKYIVWEFASRAGEPLGLLVHLGMSGRFGLARSGDPRVAHTHLVVGFDDAREVRFVDARRFGALRVRALDVLLAESPLADLGPEPLAADFDGDVLARNAGHRKRPLRDVLLDQAVVAGIGNIYAIEACHRAGIHPLAVAHRLTDTAWSRLAIALREILTHAIVRGGTTLKDFRDVTGEPGRNQDDLQVYGRAGQACVRCGATLVAFESAGRSGVFCPRDQPRVRGRIR